MQEGLVIASEGSYRVAMVWGLSDLERGKIERGEWTQFCCGLIKYKDILGKERETGFCWEYRRTQNDFIFSSTSKLNHYT